MVLYPQLPATAWEVTLPSSPREPSILGASRCKPALSEVSPPHATDFWGWSLLPVRGRMSSSIWPLPLNAGSTPNEKDRTCLQTLPRSTGVKPSMFENTGLPSAQVLLTVLAPWCSTPRTPEGQGRGRVPLRGPQRAGPGFGLEFIFLVTFCCTHTHVFAVFVTSQVHVSSFPFSVGSFSPQTPSGSECGQHRTSHTSTVLLQHPS